VLENRIRKKMKQNKLAIGTYVNLADSKLIEIVGLAGFDAAFIDLEHNSYDLKTVEEMIRACDLVGITSLVRVQDSNPKTILRILDMGAQAIQIPHIASKSEAVEAVKAVRYAPLGDRGMYYVSRASHFGTVPVKEHIKTSNSEIVLIVMVEDAKAIRELGDIASVEGLDLIAIGPSDLSANLGITDRNDPKLKEPSMV
jgi:4-hydroxy-2-oxoheptanedioate aldolase